MHMCVPFFYSPRSLRAHVCGPYRYGWLKLKDVSVTLSFEIRCSIFDILCLEGDSYAAEKTETA